MVFSRNILNSLDFLIDNSHEMGIIFQIRDTTVILQEFIHKIESDYF